VFFFILHPSAFILDPSQLIMADAIMSIDVIECPKFAPYLYRTKPILESAAMLPAIAG